jgi:hypothetical protein
MKEVFVNEVVVRSTVSAGGAATAWGLMDTSALLASIASIATIIYTSFALFKLLRDIKRG